MKKTNLVLAVTGGVIALAVLVLAVLTALSFMDRTAALEGDEETEGLEAYVGRVVSLMGKKPFPSPANKVRIDENRQTVRDCCSVLRKEASKGDWSADESCRTPAQFKELIAREAKAFGEIGASAKEPFLKADFGFGPFKDYLADKMPAAEQLKRLQRQWFDVTSLLEVLVTNGVTQVADLQTVERQEEDVAKSGAKRPRRTKAAAETSARKPSVETYKVQFTASPAALVGVLRQLSFQDRFTVVESFGFVRQRDAIAEALGGAEKPEAQGAPAGRRRRRAAAVAEERPAAEADQKADQVVFDPAADAAVNAELVVSVYDFRTLEEDEKGAEK